LNGVLAGSFALNIDVPQKSTCFTAKKASARGNAKKTLFGGKHLGSAQKNSLLISEQKATIACGVASKKKRQKSLQKQICANSKLSFLGHAANAQLDLGGRDRWGIALPSVKRTAMIRAIGHNDSDGFPMTERNKKCKTRNYIIS
jgi:hypothetical protein